jgi:hypothetical protein
VIAISCSSFVNAVGLPPIRPFFLATSRPALTLSFIKSRSNSASDPKILNINLPVLVVVSIDSVIDLKPTSLSINYPAASGRVIKREITDVLRAVSHIVDLDS